jgi:adenylate cyclase
VSRSRGFSRFVGRADEMATLELALHGATEGNGQVVGVVGEAGVGKSRLCLEFVERCRANGTPVYEAHCPSHGKTVPFLPLLELLRDLLGVSDRDPPLKVREAIAGRVLLLDRDLEEFLPLVFDFLGVADPEQRAPTLDPDTRQRRLFAFVRRLVQGLSAREPTLILVDDLHWIDGASDAFLSQIVEAVGGSRSMLLVNFRPEYRAEWMQRSYYLQLPLAPLGPEAIAELLGDLLGEDASLVGLHDRIVQHTGGNPFFIEEVVHALVESGVLEGTQGRYRLVESIERIKVPGTVQAVLAARIDRLADREKQVLQTAAVIGRSFGESTLERVARLAGPDLVAALATLQAAEFVRQEALYPRAEYAFRHPLTHQVAYESQLGERRARVHGTVARALEEEHAESLDEHAALLAHHWEQAGESLEAARWHRRAARSAGWKNPKEALNHWRRCAALVAGLPPSPEVDAIRVDSSVGIIRGATSMLDVTDQEAEMAFHGAATIATRGGDPSAQTKILLDYGLFLGTRQRYQEASPVIDEAVRVSDRTDDRGLRAATRSSTMSMMALGRLQEARVRCEEGLAIVGKDPLLGSEIVGNSPLAILTINLGWVLCQQGHLAEGSEKLDRGIELARQNGYFLTTPIAHLYSAVAGMWAGDPERCMRAARTMAAIAEQVESPTVQFMYRYTLGVALSAREDWDAVVRSLESSMYFGSTSYLVRAYLERGESSRARAAAEQALAFSRETGQLVREIVDEVMLARVLRTIDPAGEMDAIEASLSRAEELVRETGARIGQPSIGEERGRLAQALGRPAEAAHHLREAHRLYTEMGATGHAERLAQELAAAES